MAFAREILHHFHFRLRLHARMAIDITSALAGLALLAFGGVAITDIIGALLTLTGTVLLVRDLAEKRRRSLDTRMVPNPDFAATIDEAVLPPGFVARTTVAGRYMTSEVVNAALEQSSSPLALSAKPYEVPEHICDHRARCMNALRPQFNEAKLGLRSDLTPDFLAKGETANLERTDYFSGVCTNEVAALQFESLSHDRRGRPQLTFAIADLIVAGGRLIDLSESALSNHIGASTLVITADHAIVLQEQGNQMVSGMKIGIGASGSLDVGDAVATPGRKPPAYRTLQDMIRHGVEREAAEELTAAVGPGHSTTWLTGYARYLDRGGKPEFFGITHTTSKLADLQPTKRETGFVHRVFGRPFAPSRQGLIDAIDLLIGPEGNPAGQSLSMTVCLRLARDYLAAGGTIEF